MISSRAHTFEWRQPAPLKFLENSGIAQNFRKKKKKKKKKKSIYLIAPTRIRYQVKDLLSKYVFFFF
jgi:hypothetical protein